MIQIMLVTVVKEVCKELGLAYKNVDADGVFLRVDLGNNNFHLCIADNLGLNDEVVEKICRDKAYSYALLEPYIKMPKTISYVDSKFSHPEIGEKLHEQIASEIFANFQFPVILKPNSKSSGTNVLLCTNSEEVTAAVTQIFNTDSFAYDHVLLAQEQIHIAREFRVIVYKGEIQFLYQKDNTGSESRFVGNLSPLHYENAKAVLIDESKENALVQQIKDFIAPLFVHLKLQYAGLDIAVDGTGQLYLFELNSRPAFEYFIRDNGNQKVAQLVKRVLTDLSARS